MADHHEAAGLHSHTRDDVLINHYLLPKVIDGGHNYSFFPFINEANVYSKPPHQVTAEHAPAAPGTGRVKRSVWYFFSRLRYTSDNHMRRSRTVAGAADGMKACWHPETGRKKVNGTTGGYIKKFSYQVKKTASAEWVRSGWVMAEYSCSIDDGRGCGDTVLCKVHRSPRQASGSGAQPARTRARRQASRLVSSSAGVERAAASPPQLAPGADGHSGLRQQAESFANNEDDAKGTLEIPHGEDMDAFYENCLLRGGGGYDESTG